MVLQSSVPVGRHPREDSYVEDALLATVLEIQERSPETEQFYAWSLFSSTSEVEDFWWQQLLSGTSFAVGTMRVLLFQSVPLAVF